MKKNRVLDKLLVFGIFKIAALSALGTIFVLLFIHSFFPGSDLDESKHLPHYKRFFFSCLGKKKKKSFTTFK